MALKNKTSDTFNIQSFLRIRPLGAKEKRSPHLDFKQREVTIKCSSDFQKSPKSFLFDQVFHEDSKQEAVYSTIVRPMIKEVIQGYNCTIFAYGQTGSGKTYTITGSQEDADVSWTEDSHAGIIPRALEDIFTELSNQTSEYHVSISFMELYNEKLSSLLSDSDDDTTIKLIDDMEGGVILKGLSSAPVKSRDEAIQLLEKGTEKKQIAATLMNMNSSRSHTIFTINVKVKENSLDRDDLLRLGKLHLVDLAGSENVSKSGASDKANKSATGVNRRLAEASNINKSLLTLGRVITSITENNPHIPYRESKLTRLLRDSLGGKTKTCIIGTISPSLANMDESESTLNYVSKARAIQNKPEKNRSITSKEFMQAASEEIVRLKRDLELSRKGDGFHISTETYEEMVSHMTALDSQVKKWSDRYNSLNAEFENHQEQFSALRDDYGSKCAEYEESVKLFETELNSFNQELSEISKEVIIRKFFIREYQKREKSLTEDAKKYKTVVEIVATHNGTLLDKISSQAKNEQRNIEELKESKHAILSKMEELEKSMDELYKNERNKIKALENAAGSTFDALTKQKSRLEKHLAEFEAKVQERINDLLSCKQNMVNKIENEIDSSVSLSRKVLLNQINNVGKLKKIVEDEAKQIKNNFENLIEIANTNIENLRGIMEMCKMPKHISQGQRMYQDIHQCLLSKMHKLNLNIELAAKRSSRSSESASIAQMKLQKVEEYLTDLKSILKKSSSTSKECDDKMNHVQNVCTKIPQTMQKMTVSEDIVVFNQKMSELQRSLGEGVEESGKVKSQLSNLTENIQRNNSFMETRIQSVQESLELQDNAQLERKNHALCTVNSFDTNLDEKMQVLFQEPNQFGKELQEEIGDTVDMELRKQSNFIEEYSQNISHFEELSSNKLGDLRQTLQEIQYSSVQPQGSTSQRVNRSDLHCPTYIAATAPVEVLVAKFYQERNQSMLDEKIHPVSSNQTPSSSCESLVCAENVLVSGVLKSKKKLRKSTSLPNLQIALEEDKENLP